MIGEGGLVTDKDDTDVDAGGVDESGAGETRSVLENTFGTETETGMENLEDGADVGLDEGTGLDKATGVDLADDELGVTETGLGLTDGFGAGLVFGRCEVIDEQL